MGRKCQQEHFILQSNSFRNPGEIKTVPGKQKLWEFITTRPTLQEILKGIFQA